METVTLARNAMATRFEIVLHGARPSALRAAGEEALDEIDRLEARLSLYRPTSEIAQINARAFHEPVRVSPIVFSLLRHAQKLSQETGGAFDITIAPLVRCWGFMNGTGRLPSSEEISEAKKSIGMEHVILDEEHSTVHFTREGMMLDLGAIGKGFALGRATNLLREAGIERALLHGGTSTVCAIGKSLDDAPWKIALEPPTGKIHVHLSDESLSVSAIWGRSFSAAGQTFGHVIDPRTARPSTHAIMSAVILSDTTETDALSTALLVAGPSGHDVIAALRPDMRSLIISPIGQINSHGLSLS